MSIQAGQAGSQALREGASGAHPRGGTSRIGAFLGRNVAWIFLALLIIVPAATNADFRSLNNIQGFLVSAGLLMILGVGESFVLIIAGVDLAVGGGVALGSVLVAEFLQSGMGVWLAAVITVVIISLTGVLNGLAVAKLKLPSFIVTFAMLAAEVSVALVISGGNRIDISATSPLAGLAVDTFAQIPYQVWLALAILLAGEVFLRWTARGRHLYAVGSNMNAARVSGISPDRVIVTAFAISAGISGLAGLVYASHITAGDPTAAGNLNLEAIAAAVIGGVSLFGGRGKLVGGFLGAVIYELITNVLYLYGVNSNVAELVGGIVIIMAAFSNVVGTRGARE